MKHILLALVVSAPLLSGCESMGAKVDASRQDRCQRADWALVGERDGFDVGREFIKLMGDRYQNICGDMFKPDIYAQGAQKGLARRPASQGR